MKVRNARILSTRLGTEGHGIPTAWVHLDYGGAGQGFGGFNLTDPAHHRFVFRVLEVVGVESWEDLPGRSCRIIGDDGRVLKIGHYLEDRWYCPSEEGEARSR